MICQSLKRHAIRYTLLTLKLSKDNYKWGRRDLFSTLQILQKENAIIKNGQWNVLFFGTDDFALESLKRLHDEYRSERLLNRLEAVTAYKGYDENAILKYAREHKIKVHNWPLEISLADFDIGLVVSFGHLIPTRIIQSFPLGMLNVHASLLPRWRGAAPIIHTLMNGDEITGVTIMKIAPKKFDIGEILAQEKIDINPHECQPELHNRLANLGGDMLINTIKKLPGVIHSGKPQSSSDVTYAVKIRKEHSIIKWREMNAQDVYNLQRALTGIFPLRTTFEGEDMKLFGIKLRQSLPEDVHSYELNPGITFFDKTKRLLMIQCNEGDWITVEQVGLPGRKKMSAFDFNNGFMRNRRDQPIVLGKEEGDYSYRRCLNFTDVLIADNIVISLSPMRY